MKKITWKFTQQNSDDILSDGIWQLTTRPFEPYNTISHSDFGNYLISYDKQPYYIGEAKDICKRIKQQFKPATSTFFKNYQKYAAKNEKRDPLLIDHFKVQHIPTLVGRKEIEEFGIVNLPTLINNFQLCKRSKQQILSKNGIWNETQNQNGSLLKEAEKEIFNQKSNSWIECCVPNIAGLYIVKDKKKEIIYIGESSNVYERYDTHSNKTYFSALRRHIATEVLHFELKEKNGKKKYLYDNEEKAVSTYLKTCIAIFYPTSFGRYELEEYLIRQYKPLLNRKDNKEQISL